MMACRLAAVEEVAAEYFESARQARMSGRAVSFAVRAFGLELTGLRLGNRVYFALGNGLYYRGFVIEPEPGTVRKETISSR
jgi:hypothetical protein